MKKILCALGTCLMMAGAAQAVNVNWSGGGTTDDWNDTGNWGGTVPGANADDKALFNGASDSNTPTLDFAFALVADVTLRNDAVITIGTGVNISNFGNWRLGANANNNGGHVVMTGGSLSGGSFLVASSPSATSRSTFTVSGGTLTTSGGFSLGTLADFNLTGDTASFDVGSFTANGGSVFNVTFNSSGISSVDSTGSFTIGATASLNVDLTDFSGGGTFDLVKFGSISGSFAEGNISITGLDGRTAWIGYDADSMYVTVYAPTTDFNTGVTGLWTSDNKWTAGVPGPDSTSVILANAKATLDTAASINTLTVADTATLNVGDGGVLTAGSDVTFEAGSTYQVGIGATSCGKIDIGGALILGNGVDTYPVLNLGTMQGTQRTIAVFDGALTGLFKDTSGNVLSNGSALPLQSGYWIHYVTTPASGRKFIAITTSSSTPTSSGIDLRAFETAEGVVVEFVAYDVEADGSIRLELLGEDGSVVWSGTVDVTAGPQFIARFPVPGLEPGGSYDFRVRDEVGQWWDAPGVSIGTFGAEMTSASLTAITLTFDSLPGRDYEIQWLEELGGTWQTVTNVTAGGEQTSVVVSYPDTASPSGFFRVQAD